MAKKPVSKKKPDPEKKARVHKELDGFEIKVNPLGEITSNYSIEDINKFLNRHVRDKKLVNRDGQFGGNDEDDLYPVEDGIPEVEESEEDFMARTSKPTPKKSTRKGKVTPESDDDDEDFVANRDTEDNE